MTVQPEDVPAAIEVEWTETSKVKARIDLELAREMFGLGGTSDDEMESKVMAVLAWSPGTMLDRLAQFADVSDPYGHQVLSLNGMPRGDW